MVRTTGCYPVNLGSIPSGGLNLDTYSKNSFLENCLMVGQLAVDQSVGVRFPLLIKKKKCIQNGFVAYW